ncbi:MAG: hypothetical protein E7609_07860 [Ruminococcaceae bacterium]|nr:hypothetical protein [Oscillospiraceae bacterium]
MNEKEFATAKENAVDTLEENKMPDAETDVFYIDGRVVCFSLSAFEKRVEAKEHRCGAPQYNAGVEFPQCELD